MTNGRRARVWQALRITLKFSGIWKLSLCRFGEIKQVNACSIQVCHGSVEINAWKTFVLRVEHPYLNLWIWVSLPSMLRNCMLPSAAPNQSACFSFRLANCFLKLHKKHTITASAPDDFTEHYIIRLVSACELVLLPMVTTICRSCVWLWMGVVTPACILIHNSTI